MAPHPVFRNADSPLPSIHPLTIAGRLLPVVVVQQAETPHRYVTCRKDERNLPLVPIWGRPFYVR